MFAPVRLCIYTCVCLRAQTCAGGGLDQREEQGEIAVNALALQLLRGLDALPGARNLDEDAILRGVMHRVRRGNQAHLRDSCFLVELNQFAGLLDGGLLVEREARVDLSGDATCARMSAQYRSAGNKPGTILRISRPKLTESLSMASST